MAKFLYVFNAKGDLECVSRMTKKQALFIENEVMELLESFDYSRVGKVSDSPSIEIAFYKKDVKEHLIMPFESAMCRLNLLLDVLKDNIRSLIVDAHTLYSDIKQITKQLKERV